MDIEDQIQWIEIIDQDFEAMKSMLEDIRVNIQGKSFKEQYIFYKNIKGIIIDAHINSKT